ncbi:MAG: hypothetical protein RL226_825 [Bacteroidota bacterium]
MLSGIFGVDYFTLTKTMDKYDYILLEVILTYKQQHGTLIRLGEIETLFWKRIEQESNISLSQAHVGERLARLYVTDLIQNKNGYCLTRKGKEVLSYAPEEINSVAS